MATGTKSAKLAKSLTGLSGQLVELGRLEEALRAIQKAVELYRPLSQENPDEHAGDLACALNSLSNRLFAMNDNEGALKAVREAIELEGKLSINRPIRCTTNLASSHCNCARFLMKEGELDEALKHACGALAYYRILSQSEDDGSVEERASSQFYLSGLFYVVGFYEPGEQATLGVVNDYDSLSSKDPEKYCLAICKSLDLLGLHLAGLGRHQEALDTACQSVTLSWQLADRCRWILADFPAFLANYSSHLSSLGQHENALRISYEVMKLIEHLSPNHPTAFASQMAMALDNASSQSAQLGNHAQALFYSRKAVESYRQLVTESATVHKPRLIGSLNNLSNHLCNAGYRAEALETIQEAMTLLQQMLSFRLTWSPTLDLRRARLLGTLCEHQFNMDHHDEALRSINEALALDRQHIAEYPDVFEPVLARHLQNLAFCLIRLGREDEALPALDEVLSWCHSWIDDLPLVFSELHDNCARMRSHCLFTLRLVETITEDDTKPVYRTID